jgi:hypothetical protein
MGFAPGWSPVKLRKFSAIKPLLAQAKFLEITTGALRRTQGQQ